MIIDFHAHAFPGKLAANIGGLWNWDRVANQLADTGAFLDTSDSLGRQQKTDDFYTDEQLQLLTKEQFCRLVDIFGKKRVLFGADNPWSRQLHTRKQIEALPLSQDTKDHIFYNSACRLLKMSF